MLCCGMKNPAATVSGFGAVNIFLHTYPLSRYNTGMEITKIILCGRRCTGKTTLFWDLQKTLNWPIFSISEFLREYIHRHNLKSLADIDSKSYDISADMDNRMENLLTTPDRVVIDARVYGKIRDPIPHALKVLLSAREEVRLRRAAYREGTTEEVQKKKLLRKEAEWIAKLKVLYPFDFFDPAYYDLTIDTSDLKPDQVLDAAVSALGKSDNQAETVIYNS